MVAVSLKPKKRKISVVRRSKSTPVLPPLPSVKRAVKKRAVKHTAKHTSSLVSVFSTLGKKQAGRSIFAKKVKTLIGHGNGKMMARLEEKLDLYRYNTEERLLLYQRVGMSICTSTNLIQLGLIIVVAILFV